MLSEIHHKPSNGDAPSSLVVFLHGYGASGDNLIGLAHTWDSALPSTHFIAPNAPKPCEINPLGYQWFGLKDFNPLNIRSGIDSVNQLLTNYMYDLLNKYSLKSEQLFIVGFSQGAMLALEMMFHIPNLGGIIGYSGAFYPPVEKSIPQPYPPVLLVHGTMDMVVPYPAMLHAEQTLALYGLPVETLTCEGLGHSIDGQGATAGAQFIQQCLQERF